MADALNLMTLANGTPACCASLWKNGSTAQLFIYVQQKGNAKSSYLYHNFISMNLQKTWRNNSNVNTATNRLTIVLFVIYLIALYWILLFKLGVRFSNMGSRSVNLIPFNGPIISNSKINAGEIILNVIIFIPLGIYAGILFSRWTFKKRLFFILLMSLIIEGLQFILTIGVFDVTDITTNTLGGIIGLMLFKATEKAFNDSIKAQKCVNIIAVAGTAVMILMLFLLKMNLLPLRYQ